MYNCISSIRRIYANMVCGLVWAYYHTARCPRCPSPICYTAAATRYSPALVLRSSSSCTELPLRCDRFAAAARCWVIDKQCVHQSPERSTTSFCSFGFFTTHCNGIGSARCARRCNRSRVVCLCRVQSALIAWQSMLSKASKSLSSTSIHPAHLGESSYCCRPSVGRASEGLSASAV
jgi:hypothetical protein